MATLDRTLIPEVASCWTKIGVWGTQTPRCEKLDKAVHCRNCAVYTNAGRGLLGRKPSPDYIDEWTTMLARSNESAVKATTSLLVFRVGDEFVAISIRLVKEIVEMGRMHKIPHRNNSVLKGLVSIRGELKLCVSVGNLLGLRKCEVMNKDQRHLVYSERVVVVVKDGKEFAFPVSEVMGIRRVDPNTMQDAPSTISNSTSPYITGVFKIDDRNIGMIDEDHLFSGLDDNLI